MSKKRPLLVSSGLLSWLPACSGLALLLASSSASAATTPNLAVSYVPPALTAVYSAGTYGVTVANIGSRDAGGVQLTIQMPKTGTSPQVYIMGDLVPGYSSTCVPGGAVGTAAGSTLVCGLGTVRRGKAKTVTFSIELPEKTGALTFSASATTTTSPETDPSNNTNVAHTAALDYYENTFSFDTQGEASYLNKHCTGSNLSAYFECTKFASSISSHEIVVHADGSITFPGEPDYAGSWTLSGDRLTFEYIFIPSGEVEVEFSGRGVAGTGCFEGLTRFPDGSGGYGPYVSPYEVCPQ